MVMKLVSMKTSKTTPIDFIENGSKKRVEGFADTRLVKHGLWKLNGVPGKTLCLIQIAIPELKITLNFIPSESFQDELLCSWLDAERKNDDFIFEQPLLTNKRPSQLRKKIEHLRKVLEDYFKAYCED